MKTLLFSLALLLGIDNPRSATLLIRSVSLGAQIEIDGQYVGDVPMKFPLALRAGRHSIKLSLPGHTQYLNTFRIHPGQDLILDIHLLPISAALKLSCEAPGAQLYLDGYPLGALPFEGELEPGSYLLELKAPGFSVWRRRLKLEAGRSYPFEINLLLLKEPLAPKEASGYSSIWLWVGGGALILGGLSLLLFMDEEKPSLESDLVVEMGSIE